MSDDDNPILDEDESADWPDMDIEAAYRRALEANDVAEWEIGHAVEDAQVGTEVGTITTDGDPNVGDVAATSTDNDPTSLSASLAHNEADSTDVVENTSSTETGSQVPEDALPERVTPQQVIEAALFVGGQPLTAKKLCYVLRGDFDLDFIEQTIDALNHQYLDEERPYEIRLGEGGYRLVLHEEFQRLRNRVYGIGPREVKLSQDVLEVMALVAYRQPVTQGDIEALGKSNPGPALRQLLRRELISLERDPQDRKNVKYRTTRRFLSVFGLGTLDELPQADELMFK